MKAIKRLSKKTHQKTPHHAHLAYLEGVEFIVPKRLSSPKIVYTLCLVNEGNLPIAHTMMFVIVKREMTLV